MDSIAVNVEAFTASGNPGSSPPFDISLPSPEPQSPGAYPTSRHATSMRALSSLSLTPEAQLRLSDIPSDLHTITEAGRSMSRSNSQRHINSPPAMHTQHLPDHSEPMPSWQSPPATGSDWPHPSTPPPAYSTNVLAEPVRSNSLQKIETAVGGQSRI
ncbi:hypothetical protein DENSPDRAFT_834915 [Dentipellis sp. KUC8613]|nr:hypothetical protein DENSPDRAFT_834915 [Dentipellis sp. KUC8613]